VKGSYTGASAIASRGSAEKRPSPSGSGGGSQQASSQAAGSGAQATSPPSDAVKIGPSSRLPDGQAAVYRDPSTQQPDIVIRNSDGSLVAFSAVCTHAGCTVGYEGGQLVCPCHGGTYSASTGQVTGGPPPAPLARRKVIESKGSIYAIPS
jgi:thiosulfate dehydrogenase [quinone] large subunit